MAVPNPLPRTADGLPVGKGSDITDGGGGFALTLPDWIDVIDEALDEQTVRFDLTNDGDVTFAAASFSGGVATGGNIAGNGFRVAQDLGTMTADVDPVDPSIGTPYLFTYDFTAHAGDNPTIGPQVMSGYRGPRPAFAFEGVGYWPEHMRVYSPEPMAFMDAHTERLPGTASGDRNAQFSWSFLSARTRIADGHKWTVLNNDTRNGPIPFFDNQVWVSGNGGEISGTTGTPSYPVGDFDDEHDAATGRWVSSFSAGPHMYGKVSFSGYAMFAGHDINTELTNPTGPTYIEIGEVAISGAITVDTPVSDYPVATQMTFYSPRLFAGADNYSSFFNSHSAWWGDTYTFDSTDPKYHTPGPVITVGIQEDGTTAATHTYDFANAAQTIFRVAGTWKFKQAGSALGAFSVLNAQPTISNDTSLTGTVLPLAVMMSAAPIYSMNTTGATVVATDVRSFHSKPTFSRSAGANTFETGATAGFYGSATVNSGAAILARYGLYVEDGTGAGTITTQFGIYIEALAKATNNVGIQNLASSVLTGGVYGDTASNGDLNLYGTTHATDTTSYINLNDKTVALEGLYGSASANGDLDLYGTTHATTTTSYINFNHKAAALSGLYGSISSAGNLDLYSTAHATSGAINVNDPLELFPTDETFTASPTWVYMNNTYTLNFVNVTTSPVINLGPTILTQQTHLGGFGLGSMVAVTPTHKNTPATAVTMRLINSYGSSPTFTADGATVTHATVFRGFTSASTWSVANSGTWAGTSGTFYDYDAQAATIGASVTLGTRAAFHVADSANSGTLTTQYGLDIAALAAGTTNVGIRNLSTMRQVGAITVGADAAATWLAHIQGGNAATSGLGIDISTTGPTAPASNAAGVISIYKGATNYYFLITFNDGGTTRYKHLKINGTGTTAFTESTTLPT